MIQIRDQLNREVVLEHYPSRIISLVPSLTELLVDLGLADKIVGRTKFCIHPAPVVKSITRVGGTKTPDIEEIERIRPDLIIVSKEENVKEQIDRLAQKFTIYVSDINSVETALEAIHQIAGLTDTAEQAVCLCGDISNSLSALRTGLGRIGQIPVAYLIWNEPFMTVGGDTFIHNMLVAAGFDNVFGKRFRYPEISLNEIVEAGPKYLFMSSEPYPFSEKHIQQYKATLSDFGIIPIIIDGEMFSWYGSRMIKAAVYFSKLRHFITSNTIPPDSVILYT